jgi:hypothetical protein
MKILKKDCAPEYLDGFKKTIAPFERAVVCSEHRLRGRKKAGIGADEKHKTELLVNKAEMGIKLFYILYYFLPARLSNCARPAAGFGRLSPKNLRVRK